MLVPLQKISIEGLSVPPLLKMSIGDDEAVVITKPPSPEPLPDGIVPKFNDQPDPAPQRRWLDRCRR